MPPSFEYYDVRILAPAGERRVPKALGLALPQAVVIRADKVIE